MAGLGAVKRKLETISLAVGNLLLYMWTLSLQMLTILRILLAIIQ